MQGIVNEKKLYIYIHKNINICIGLKPWKRTVLHSFFLVLPFGSSREACLVMSCHLILWNTDTTNDNKSEWWLSMPNCVPQAEIHLLFQSPLGLYAAPWLPIPTSRWRLTQQPMLRPCIGWLWLLAPKMLRRHFILDSPAMLLCCVRTKKKFGRLFAWVWGRLLLVTAKSFSTVASLYVLWRLAVWKTNAVV